MEGIPHFSTIYRCNDRGIIHAFWQRRFSMEGFTEGSNLFLPVEGSQLHGISFASAPELRKSWNSSFPETFPVVGQPCCRDIGLSLNKSHLVQLVNNWIKMRVCMTDRNYGMTSVHIQVLLPSVIPEIGASCPGNGYFIYWVYFE
jgi:hypothetical protein